MGIALMQVDPHLIERLKNALQRDRLIDTAVKLVEIPSPTRDAGAVSDRLAAILADDGFDVERPIAGWKKAPAVVARFSIDDSARTLQFNGHLDTVHLPFVPPRVENGKLYGSGASDMKGGIAAMVEAMRILKETQTLPTGSVLLTAHDLHESPWGDGSQVDALIDDGYVGDGVLLPEYLCDQLPILGRGLAVLEVSVTREGEPLHEVLGGIEQPSVIGTGADIVRRFAEWNQELKQRTHPMGVCESAFVGSVSSGEIYNQSPTEFRLSGTRRWLPGTDADTARREFHDHLAAAESGSGTQVEGEFHFTRDAFELDPNDWLVESFQSVAAAVMGEPLPLGVKPFVDDGNTFAAKAGIPAITHGPNAKGAHTLHEEVPIAELERVALVYALTAITFCDA
ncbi:MAG: M20/M25/M40 family metallo-hydrolase [Planctomycetes bacterium]|nr:M20/M25/M40 family metallo-hydrolase [Planctomycetota bacterium]